MRAIRCAIYTRKSSEEGLEQDFNSLDAQREACAAYVLSQASEGWTALPDIYDDGGISGGTLERPALQRLLADIALGKVDIVVVYKVDRLTRSLLDFAKLVEAFDSAGVSFVSVTQSFNTTSSMGRLTLNMLLSFAQFEREVTAERIRDKLAASKAKGMWMGGIPPLGYEPDGRTLRIVPDHAALIRHIYDRYLVLGNVRLVAEQFAQERVCAPNRTTRSGRAIGGGPFSRGQLYAILKSPIYVGDIPHKDRTYPGLHDPIIDRNMWDAVQARLAEQVKGERRGPRASSTGPLAGKVVDAEGNGLIASHACKGDRRYRYYVSRDGASDTMRIPAIELETAVGACLGEALDDPVQLAARAWLRITPSGLNDLATRAPELAARARRRDRDMFASLIDQVRVRDAYIEIICDVAALADMLGMTIEPGAPPTLPLRRDIALRRTGRAMRLIQPDGAGLGTHPSQSLIKVIVKARRWWRILCEGEINIATLARQEGMTRSYVTRIVRLAFLAPEIVDAILAGTTKAGVDAEMMTTPGIIDHLWNEQVATLLPAV